MRAGQEDECLSDEYADEFTHHRTDKTQNDGEYADSEYPDCPVGQVVIAIVLICGNGDQNSPNDIAGDLEHSFLLCWKDLA